MSDPTEELPHVMSLLEPEDMVRLNGIPPQAAVAAFAGDQPPARLQGNPAFVELMHAVIRRRAPESAEMQVAARAQRHGYLYVIDALTPDGIHGDVPPVVIIAAFKLENGSIVDDWYWENAGYAVYREGRGLVRLPGTLHDALLAELRTLAPLPASPVGQAKD